MEKTSGKERELESAMTEVDMMEKMLAKKSDKIKAENLAQSLGVRRAVHLVVKLAKQMALR